MEKEVISAVIVTTIVANILTYQSFRYYKKPTTKGATSDAIVMYPLVNLYVVLYSMLILLTGKWAVDVCHMTFSFDKEKIQSIITESIQASFQGAIRMVPFSVLMGFISFFFEKNLLFTPTGKFSPYYLSFAFIINLCAMLIYKNNPVDLSDQNIISYFIILVTIISIFKVNQPTLDTKNASSSLDRFVTFCINFFLNFNMKIVYVLMPFILFFTMIFFTITGTTFEQILKLSVLSLLFVFILIIVALIHGAIKKHQRKSKSGRDSANNLSKVTNVLSNTLSTAFNPAVLRPFLKTGMYLVLYSIPLAFYVYFTSNDFSILKQKYFKTFNKSFLEILAMCYIATAVLQKFITISQQQINKFVSLQIVIALVLTNKAGQ